MFRKCRRYLTLNKLPGNIPNATGAKKAVVLGKIALV
ncbi:anhydro-N-acetylmuramic acid kinase [[Mycoplasma] collis]